MNKLNMLTALFTGFVSFNALAITPEAFSMLSPEEALTMSHQWHRTGEANVQVLPESLVATLPSGEKATIPLNDQFLLSIAPYVNQTHPCTYHVPTGCQGEMVGEVLQLVVRDVATGEVLIDDEVKTQHDGFIDFWMPRGGDYEFAFTKNNMAVTEVLSTKGNSRTCITTMQLQ